MRVLGSMAVAVALSSRLALAQPAPAEGDAARAQASALIKEANGAYQAGQYPAALESFERAYAVFPSPRILFNLGQTYERLGRYVEATESFERFLASAGNAPAVARAEAERSLEEMRNKVARVEIVANVSGAEVSIDGRTQGTTPLPRPVLVAVGPHEVVVRKPGVEPFLMRIEAVGGTLARVDAQLRAPVVVAPGPPAPVVPSPAPTPAGLLTASQERPAETKRGLGAKVGLGLMVGSPVLATAGLLFGVHARNKARDIAEACREGCNGSNIVAADDARRQAGMAQWVLLGSGAAAAAGGAALYWLAPRTHDRSTVAVTIRVRDGGAVAMMRGRF